MRPSTRRKARQLFLFTSLISSNFYDKAYGFTICRYSDSSSKTWTSYTKYEFQLDAVTAGSRDRNGTISIDDAIASMGLTQIKKKVSTQSSILTKRRKKSQDQLLGESNNKRKKKGIKDTKKTSVLQTSLQALQQRKDISIQTQLDYSREGHASLRNFFPPDIIGEVYQDLKSYSTDKRHRRKGEDTTPFLQFYNTWRDLPSVKQLVTSPLLCQAACAMLNLPVSETMSSQSPSSTVKLRLYQDSVFIKRKNKDGITPWHIDGRMMPFDTSHAITFWIPLHPIPAIDEGGTGLLFINKSHSDFSLPYWNGRGTEYHDEEANSSQNSYGIGYNAYDHLTTRYGIENVGDDRIADNNPGVIGHHMPLNIGDCTVHNGWTMHCANGNKKNMNKKPHSKGVLKTRYAIAISYIDSHAEVRGDIPGVGKNLNLKKNMPSGLSRSSAANAFLGDAEDSASYTGWIGDVLPRTRFEHKLLPDVWPSSIDHSSAA